MNCASDVKSKNSPRSQRFYFFLKLLWFYNLHLSLWPFLVSFCIIYWTWVAVVCFAMDTHLLQQHLLLKGLSFLCWTASAPLSKSVTHICVALFLGLRPVPLICVYSPTPIPQSWLLQLCNKFWNQVDWFLTLSLFSKLLSYYISSAFPYIF